MILVIGSINMDLVCRTPRMPKPGETILGGDFQTIPGGKGANQAVAAAKLGGDVHMIGRVGDDDLGKQLLAGLRSHGVNTRHVRVTQNSASGIATILVDARGENSIVVAPGANARLSPADIDAALSLIRKARVVVLQLEVPPNTVAHAIRLCRRLGVKTILDPAPARPLPRSVSKVDLISPNETEAKILVGSSRDPGRALLDAGASTVVLKLGSRGAEIVTKNAPPKRVRPFKIRPVDTTAAGDAFTGALAVGLTEGLDLPSAVRLANAAGAVCCTRFGAQPSLPSRSEVDKLLAGR